MSVRELGNAIGNPLALPRVAQVDTYTPADKRSIYCMGAATYDSSLNTCYVLTSGYTLVRFSLEGDLIWSVGLSANINLEDVAIGGNGIKGVDSLTGTTVLSFDAHGNLKWQKTLTGVGSIYCVQGDLSDNTYVVSFTPTTNSWITKLDSTGALVWSYSFGALTNPGSTRTYVAPNGDVWLSLTQTVTNTVAEAYKISAASTGTIPRLRVYTTGVNVRAGGIMVDTTGNIFFATCKQTSHELRVINSSGTSVTNVTRTTGSATGFIEQLVHINPNTGVLHTIGSHNDAFNSGLFIANYTFSAPSTLTLVDSQITSTIGGTAGNFGYSSFYDVQGQLWVVSIGNLLSLGEPVVGAKYTRIRDQAPTIELVSNSITGSTSFTYAYATPATVVATPTLGSGAFTFTSLQSQVVGQVLSTADGSALLQVTDA